MKDPKVYGFYITRDMLRDGQLGYHEWRHGLRREEWNLVASWLESAAFRLRKGYR